MWTATCQSAAALDLTGLWEGQAKCTIYFENDPKPLKQTTAAAAFITQSSVNVNMQLFGTNGTGTAIDNGTNENKGTIIANSCQGDRPSYQALGKATITANDAKLNLDVNLFSPGSIAYCTVKLERTNTVDPEVGPCSGGGGATAN